jgi:hypothetical protein
LLRFLSRIDTLEGKLDQARTDLMARMPPDGLIGRIEHMIENSEKRITDNINAKILEKKLAQARADLMARMPPDGFMGRIERMIENSEKRITDSINEKMALLST